MIRNRVSDIITEAELTPRSFKNESINALTKQAVAMAIKG